MKTNENDLKTGGWYLGLDVGTNTVGWAVTDREYNIPKFHGNAMWGVRLFEEAEGASERRGFRTARRRASRARQRLVILELLFGEEISGLDPSFFMRLHESGLWEDDKACSGKYSLFNDPDYTDRDYHSRYKTIYHLRSELATSSEKHDIRLVFLAVHHLLKHRGHFLYDMEDQDDIMSADRAFDELNECLYAEYDVRLDPKDRAAFIAALNSSDLSISAKKKALKAALGQPIDNERINLTSLTEMLSGGSVKLSSLFCDDELKEVKLRLSDNIEDTLSKNDVEFGDCIELLIRLKTLFDTCRLSRILGEHRYICDAKVAQYDRNQRDLRLLKDYVRKHVPSQYYHIFSEKSDKLNNYAAYSRYKSKSGEHACKQEDFCKYLRGILPKPEPTDSEMARIFDEINDNTFLPRLKGADNGIIPYQLQKRELKAILDNASCYLTFLNNTDSDGISVKDKIISVFEFRIPYYVGPLGESSERRWFVRKAGQEQTIIRPWNFDKVVDTEKSAERFIVDLIGRCTYTGEKVLPKDSLLYSEYALLNELNPIRINGKPIPADIKEKMIDELFYQSSKKVTKKRIAAYLAGKGLRDADELTGIDDTVKSTLRSYHDFKTILTRTGDRALVERIIRAVVVFSGDKKMLRRWLRNNTHDLTDKDIAFICRLKYSDWGRLSETLLTGIKHVEGGKEYTIMDMLRRTDKNLMQLMTDEYQFAGKAQEYRDERFGNAKSLNERLDELYIPPAVRRSIRQTMRIVDELVDIKGSVPEKIFIEMARDPADKVKKERTESRKDKLLDLYKSCAGESDEIFRHLENEDDNRLRSDKLYLYYTQLGRCAYSGEIIDFDDLASGSRYDIDHIFPRSKIRDNSLDNRVLVQKKLNREKTDTYPISEEVRSKMAEMWLSWKRNGLISDKKYERLTRNNGFTDDELRSFINAQLVETRQSTKALATLLRETYGERTTIVYSKAGNVSDFRQRYARDTENSKGDYNFIKCREVNDLHHAKDAYLNVVVGNVYHTRFIERFFRNIGSEQYSLNTVFDYDVKGAWDRDRTIATVKKYMAKNNVLVTRMPYVNKGKLFNNTLFPAGELPLRKKQNLPTEKYGGYNYINAAFFCVVEFKKGKKAQRSIEAVHVYDRKAFESDPVKYYSDKGFIEPRVIVKLHVDSLLEFDGNRLWLSGKEDKTRLGYKHTSQLIVDPKSMKYLKLIENYCKRCAKKPLPITSHDGLTKEQNMGLYELFIVKCGLRPYVDHFGEIGNKLAQNKHMFESLSISEQAEILFKTLTMFRCNSQREKLDKIGIKEIGRIRYQKNISNLSSAYLINQSVTGLYEHKVDLLK